MPERTGGPSTSMLSPIRIPPRGSERESGFGWIQLPQVLDATRPYWLELGSAGGYPLPKGSSGGSSGAGPDALPVDALRAMSSGSFVGCDAAAGRLAALGSWDAR